MRGLFGGGRAVRHATLFMDREGGSAIVVPLHHNGEGGFLVEDEMPEVLRPFPDAQALGRALGSALERSRVKPEVSHRDRKRTDWPAFKASGARSVKQFEADFIRILVSGVNEANLVYQIEGFPDAEAELRVLATASPKPEDAFGDACLRVWKACRDRSV